MGKKILDKERMSRLRLIRSQNVGPATFRLLLERFGTAEVALEHLPELSARAGGRRRIRICAQARVEQEAEKLAKLGGRFIMLGDADYPEGLSLLEHEPPVLSVLGRGDLLRANNIAIVGTRNASGTALMLTRKIARELSGYVVVSGLALGIDTEAHRASLSNGTIAVLAGGVDVLYPPENGKLYDEIKEVGCVVSEMPLGEQPNSRHFPRRNRVISGLSLLVVVVEAPKRSGAMITARAAAEQGRLVCVCPGSALDPRAKGTNQLLRDGATLVESAEDILREIEPLTRLHLADRSAVYRKPPPLLTEPNKGDYETLLTFLSEHALPRDELMRLSGENPHFVNVMLTDLEIAGRVHRNIDNDLISVLE